MTKIYTELHFIKTMTKTTLKSCMSLAFLSLSPACSSFGKRVYLVASASLTNRYHTQLFVDVVVNRSLSGEKKQ